MKIVELVNVVNLAKPLKGGNVLRSRIKVVPVLSYYNLGQRPAVGKVAAI